MHKALSSFLIAVSIYLLVIASVLYVYTQYRPKLSEVTTEKPRVVAFDVVSTAASKPIPKKPTESKKESEPGKKPVSHIKKQETKVSKKPPLPRTIETERAKKPPVTPLQKPIQASTPQDIEPTTEKTVPPLIPTPVIIRKDPAKALALKHIPQPIPVQVTKSIRKPASSLTKQRIKKRQANAKQYQTYPKKRSRSARARQGNGTHKKKSSRRGRSSFLAKLKARINRNKHYPRIAERRGITGTVHARFTILRSGRVGKISLSGENAFYSSTKSAIKHAFPIDPAKVPLLLPYRTGLVMRYR